MCERDWYRGMMSKVDPGRVRGDLAIGLRDGALFALLASGLGFAEASRLDFTAFAIHEVTKCLHVTIQRDGWICSKLLDAPLSARVLAWIGEVRGWNEARPVFVDSRGRRIGERALGKIVERYRTSPNGGRG